ncbi:5-carboxymethyl-2-hydroxymuconate isomerase [Phaeobacter sp. NW0010-22]|uniref:5-carboxymethyl-2-hydroxymuconate isomerase n=1 Tax=Phaeobacter sp. NW0010-22 TaxID=3135907 RepID=UPI00310C108F
MPHFMLDYSANLEELTSIPMLCDVLRKAAIETGVFPMPGIRVRAMRADYVSIADGDPKHAYLDISVRLRAGRDLETRKKATAHLFQVAKAHLAPAMEQHSIALSLEMRDIDPELSPKIGTIRDHI